MKVIAGLGNPDAKYTLTKHNVGFMFIDALADKLGIGQNDWQLKFEALTAQVRIGSEKVLLIKPQTYMNESGRSVAPLLNFFKMPLEDFFVIYDDLDLAVGTARLRKQGTSGGHNGINSLIAHIGDNHFARLRIGIGRPPANRSVVDHVLSPFTPEDMQTIRQTIVRFLPSAECFVVEGIDMAMNRYNMTQKGK